MRRRIDGAIINTGSAICWWVTAIAQLVIAVDSDVYLDTSPKLDPALELISRAAPSVEAHHRSVVPNVRRNSGGRQIIIKQKSSYDVFRNVVLHKTGHFCEKKLLIFKFIINTSLF